MGYNGNTNITGVKNSTGVNSNSLSLHNPSLGIETNIGDFLIEKIGYVDARNPTNTLQSKLKFVSTTASITNDYTYYGETITLKYHAIKDPNGPPYIGQLWGPMIGTRSLSSSAWIAGTVDNLTEVDRYINYEDDDIVEIYIDLEVTGYSYVSYAMILDDLNTDAANHGTQITYDDTDNGLDVWSSSPRIKSVQWEDDDYSTGTGNIDVSIYDPANNVSGDGTFKWAVDPDNRGGDSGSTTSTNWNFTTPGYDTYEFEIEWRDGGSLVSTPHPNPITFTISKNNSGSYDPN